MDGLIDKERCNTCRCAQLKDTDSLDKRFLSRHLDTIRVTLVGLLISFSWLFGKLTEVSSTIIDFMAIAAILIGGYPIASVAMKGLFQRNINVDMLVTIAASAAMALGDYLEAGIVIFILLVGEFLEAVTLAKTGKAMEGLASLIPDTVNLKQGNVEMEVPSASIKKDDVIIVRAGEYIPVDGVIIKGEATIDQSLLTGESMPVEKTVGDEVYSGVINKSGAIELKALKVGDETTVARIQQMILKAQDQKAPVERTVDRFAKYFVPIMILVSGVVYMATFDIRRAITVLIVACPCALVLGTPTAVIAAIGRAAYKGILIKGGQALETAGRINGVIFDKTGTLTYGAPEVVAIKQVCGHNDEDIVRIAAVAEKFSEHPLAGAILDRAKEWELLIAAPDDFTVRKGQGIEVKQNLLHIVIGNRSLLADNRIELSNEVNEFMKNRERQGETALIVVHSTEDCTGQISAEIDSRNDICCKKEICGIIILADTLRDGAAEAIASLKSLGANRITALYTGDNLRTASAIAGKLGIYKVASGLLPEDKANKIKELMEKGNCIAMVGDGINDAPALATADLGIAMGVVGSDIAVEAADVAILNDDILSVPAVISLGRKTLTIIKQNLFFAVVFNTVMIGAASLGLISMVLGAVFHQVSSLGVILNSMRLLVWNKLPPQ
ncbi:MAG: cation-translocating P-type ATPase [Thermodesulfobacteriota bacterium]|nr:cation-translocating P-type ATPase [Thermodesulfobacteriota bacterium]